MMWERRTQYIVLAVIIALFILIAVLALVYRTSYTFRAQFVRVPEIRGTIASADGTDHTIRASFEIRVNEETKTGLSVNELHRKLGGIIESMDYEALTSEDGLLYVKDKIAQDLDGFIDPDDLLGVYVWDFITDEEIDISEDRGGGEAGRNRIWDALFR